MSNGHVGRICFSRLLKDEDLAEAVKRRAEQYNVKAGVFIMIGALTHTVLGCYEAGEYKISRIEGPLEIASCTGNIALDEQGNVVIHAHIVVSNEKGEAFGGHLMKGSHVGATAELVIIEATGINLQRVFDQETKLKLLKLG